MPADDCIQIRCLNRSIDRHINKYSLSHTHITQEYSAGAILFKGSDNHDSGICAYSASILVYSDAVSETIPVT